MTTAQLIVKARKRKKWSQAELARRLGRNRSTVCGWETGNEGGPSPRNMYALANVLDIDVVKLIGSKLTKAA